MDVLSLVCVALLGLNVFQFWHWSRVIHQLIDKIMSKNYAEYVQAKKLAEPSQNVSHEHPSNLPIEDDVLKDLNRMIGAS